MKFRLRKTTVNDNAGEGVGYCLFYLVLTGVTLFQLLMWSTSYANRRPIPLAWPLLILSMLPISAFFIATFSRRRVLFLLYGMIFGFFLVFSFRHPIYFFVSINDDIQYTLTMCLFPLVLGLACRFAVTLRVWWDKSRLLDPSLCRKCGYNLTGNVSGICPECGNRISIQPRGKSA